MIIASGLLFWATLWDVPEQASDGVVRQPATSGADGHATDRRHVRRRERWSWLRWRIALRRRLPAAVVGRRSEGRQLLQRRRQRLRLRRGPHLPVATCNDDRHWCGTSNVVVRRSPQPASPPPTNCRDSRSGRPA